MPRSSGSDPNLRESICPRCGAPSAGGGLCGRCRVRETPWFSSDPRVTCTFCPTCGSRKECGVWTDLGGDRDAVTRDLVRRAVHLSPELARAAITMTLREKSTNRTVADVTVNGTLFGEPVEATTQVEIIWAKEQCDRCNRIAGSYYEGIVQVRASGRKPYPHEIGAASRIAHEVEEGCLTAGERLSFISDIDESKDGLDITVGSQRIGQEIATAIVRRLGGRFTTHPKLVGERAGKRLYRITYSVRLPRFSRGDLVIVNGRCGEVIAADGKQIRFREIATGADRTAPQDRVERRVGSIHDAREYLVTFRDGTVIGVLDPDTGLPQECPAPRDPAIGPGQHVRIVRDGEDLILVG